MIWETGALTVGGISILTIIVTKLKCYVKKTNGNFNYACGYLDKSLVEDQDEIKTIDVDGVTMIYKYKHHHEEEEDDDESYEH